MGQFACECTATKAGLDQCDWTDLYVAQFTLPDGSVVYVGGEYDTYGRIECAAASKSHSNEVVMRNVHVGASSRAAALPSSRSWTARAARTRSAT